MNQQKVEFLGWGQEPDTTPPVDTETIYWTDVGGRNVALMWTGFSRRKVMPNIKKTYTEYLFRKQSEEGDGGVWFIVPEGGFQTNPNFLVMDKGEEVPWRGFIREEGLMRDFNWDLVCLDEDGADHILVGDNRSEIAQRLLELVYDYSDQIDNYYYVQSMYYTQKMDWVMDVIERTPALNIYYSRGITC